MNREVPAARRRSSFPAFPRKINGDALITSNSGIAQFAGEVLLVHDENVDPAASELREECSAAQAGEFGSTLHGDRTLLIPVDGCSHPHLVLELVRRLPQGGKKTVRECDFDAVIRISCVRSRVYASAPASQNSRDSLGPPPSRRHLTRRRRVHARLKCVP